MPWLRDAQAAMTRYVLGGSPPDALLAHVDAPSPPSVLDRLGIHRNNTRLGLSEALSLSYPVTARLVGEDFFARLARDFLAAHPPREAPLLAWGREMAVFISSYEPARALPYLADVATLETAWNHAYHAPEAEPMAPERLGGTPPDRIGDLHLTLHPSARFITSRFPVETIWQANQPGAPADGSVELVEADHCLLVFRPRSEVVIQPLSRGSFAFLMALGLDQPLAVAWDAAMAVRDDFQLAPELGFLLSIGIFTGSALP